MEADDDTDINTETNTDIDTDINTKFMSTSSISYPFYMMYGTGLGMALAWAWAWPTHGLLSANTNSISSRMLPRATHNCCKFQPSPSTPSWGGSLSERE